MKDDEIVSQTEEANITIDFVTLSDEGNYSCTAVNKAGTGIPGYYYVKAYGKLK